MNHYFHNKELRRITWQAGSVTNVDILWKRKFRRKSVRPVRQIAVSWITHAIRRIVPEARTILKNATILTNVPGIRKFPIFKIVL